MFNNGTKGSCLILDAPGVFNLIIFGIRTQPLPVPSAQLSQSPLTTVVIVVDVVVGMGGAVVEVVLVVVVMPAAVFFK